VNITCAFITEMHEFECQAKTYLCRAPFPTPAPEIVLCHDVLCYCTFMMIYVRFWSRDRNTQTEWFQFSYTCCIVNNDKCHCSQWHLSMLTLTW